MRRAAATPPSMRAAAGGGGSATASDFPPDSKNARARSSDQLRMMSVIGISSAKLSSRIDSSCSSESCVITPDVGVDGRALLVALREGAVLRKDLPDPVSS